MSYLVHSEKDRKKMLKAIGIDSIESLFDAVPGKILDPELSLDKPKTEKSIKEKLCSIGKKNKKVGDYLSFLGGGAYNHYIPAALKEIISDSQFYTAYTPYQAEISQGTLQYIFEFQSFICRLTGMDISNASVYDGASALAEAVLMANRINGRREVIFPETVNPQYRDTCKTYCRGKEIDIITTGSKDGMTDLVEVEKRLSDDTCAVVIQNPDFFGCFEDLYGLRDILEISPECQLIMAIDPVAAAIIKSPGELGADIVVGEAQALGSALAFGGPYLGFFASKKQYLRKMPGRIVGKTVDADGKDAYVLTFQTREQHIRKSKATSNICTNHSLNALAATVYLSLMGPDGLRSIAEICIRRAHYLAEAIRPLKKFHLRFSSKFFNEFVLTTNLKIDEVLEKFYSEDMLPGIYLGDQYPGMKDSFLVAVTEMNSVESIDKYIEILRSF